MDKIPKKWRHLHIDKTTGEKQFNENQIDDTANDYGENIDMKMPPLIPRNFNTGFHKDDWDTSLRYDAKTRNVIQKEWPTWFENMEKEMEKRKKTYIIDGIERLPWELKYLKPKPKPPPRLPEDVVKRMEVQLGKDIQFYHDKLIERDRHYEIYHHKHYFKRKLIDRMGLP